MIEHGRTIDIPERRIERPDGSVEWHRIIRVPLWDEQGNVTGLVGIREDITDRKRAEEALRESEERFRAVFDNSPSLIVLKGLDGSFSLINRRFTEWFGVTPAEAASKFSCDLYPPEFAKEYSDHDEEVLNSGKVVEREVQVPHSDGTLRTIISTKFPVLGREGQVIGVGGIASDITERKRAEEALRESQRLLQTIFDTIPVGVFVKDADGKFLMVNHTFCEHIEVNPEQFLEMSPEEMWVGTEEERARTRMEDRYVMETDGRLEIPAKPDSYRGKTIWWHVIKSPLHDHSGKVVGVVGSRLDITGRIRIEEQIRQIEKMEAVGKLAGGMAHEFNNILHMILRFTELMLEQTPTNDSRHNHLVTIKSASEKGASLVRQLLGYSRKQILQPSDIDINALLSSMTNILMATIGGHIGLNFRPGRNLAPVHADAGSIEQIMLNLCINARDAMPNGGQLTLETRAVFYDEAYCREHAWAKPGNYVRISVEDSGTGIPDDVLPHIFEPFFTTKGPQEGSGLGLSMVHGLIEQQGGFIRVTSEPGRGATFAIHLPERNQTAVGLSAELQLPSSEAKATILAIEDEAGVQQLATQVLTVDGYRMMLASDGEEGLRLFEEHAEIIDLVLLDIVMPGMDGKEAYERIKAIKPGVAVLFHSGYNLDIAYTEFISANGLRLLRKPYASEELRNAVAEVLKRSRGE